jgi:branched-chain amino acid transport system permease protein
VKKVDITRLFAHRKLLWVGFLVAILIFLAAFPLYGNAYYIRLLFYMFMYATLSMSWAMFSGATGYMSLAPAAFFGAGMYTMAFLQEALPFPVIIVIGGLVSFGFALLVGLVTLRLRGIYFTIFTFGLVMFVSEVVAYTESHLFHAIGRHILPLDSKTLFYAMLVVAVATIVAIYFIRRSRLGLAMQSIGGNEEAAEHMGVNTTRIKVLTFAISAVFMGAAGVIMAPNLIYIDPRIAFSPAYSFMPILMSVFGGTTQLYGPVVGAAIFAYLERTLREQLPEYFMLTFGILLVLVILFMPHGLEGLVSRLQNKLRAVIWKSRKGGETEQHANT